MTRLMGENMMRKDGAAHLAERRAIFPTVSPKAARAHWADAFAVAADRLLAKIAPRGRADLLTDFAAPLAGEALKALTGLGQVHWSDIDRWSQAMIDGIANYAGDPAAEAACRDAVAEIHAAVAVAAKGASDAPDLIASQLAAGLPLEQVATNVALAISGGQNESRDAMAGLLWAILTHAPEAAPRDVFDEYVRWIAPIGMSPRRIAVDHSYGGMDFEAGARVFLMFGAANRDPEVFDRPAQFDPTRDAARHIAFGAGPHFCAGAPAAKVLISEIALPRLLTLPDLTLDADIRFHGWAFRGPTSLECRWSI